VSARWCVVARVLSECIEMKLSYFCEVLMLPRVAANGGVCR
jgi:hypothetical protein